MVDPVFRLAFLRRDVLGLRVLVKGGGPVIPMATTQATFVILFFFFKCYQERLRYTKCTTTLGVTLCLSEKVDPLSDTAVKLNRALPGLCPPPHTHTHTHLDAHRRIGRGLKLHRTFTK